MKQLSAIITFAAAAALGAACTGASAAPETEVIWSSVNLEPDSTGTSFYRQTFTVMGDLSEIDKIGFNQFARVMRMENPADTLTELVPGYYTISSSRLGREAAAGRDTVVFEILTKGRLSNICYGPDGVHAVLADGTTRPLKFTRESMLADKSRWSTSEVDNMPYGDAVFAINEALAGASEVSPYDAIPSFKSVTLTGGDTEVNPSEIEFIEAGADAKGPEWFRATVADGKIVVECAADRRGAVAARLGHLLGASKRTLPAAVIEDYPDLGYRGLMIDIARNYQTPQKINRLLDMMAAYGLNLFHFHFSDDEAWRLEIPGLPELTELASRRGYGKDESEHLFQIFCGNGNPDSNEGTANGYFTREDFIGMLRHADSLGIRVLPEIESPGHARAAIKAMEKRYRTTGDASWRLIEDGDTSVYTSAQSFHDNVVNPALEGPYKLMKHVASALKDMYAEAGVELPAIHIGGDEVPHNSWSGTPSVQKLMKEKGFKSEKQVHAYFVEKVQDIFKEMGLKYSGWQEIAVGHDDAYNARVRDNVYGVNCWSTIGGQEGVVAEATRGGYPVVLSNVNHYYLDMLYNYHPEERGLSWGGTVDEFDALHGYPARLSPDVSKVKGVQAQVWAETIRSPKDLERILFPKLLGVAERAWNNDSTYTDADFNAVINTRELPTWDKLGLTYHVRQAGIRRQPGNESMLEMNAPYSNAEIRYTLDGTDPDESSALYTAPVAIPADATQARARLWVNGHPSLVTILFL